MMPTLDNIEGQFQAAAQNYSMAIQPYALKLFFALFLLDFTISFVMFLGEGQLESTQFLGRIFRHILGGGFIYAMIVYGFTWMRFVIQSFSQIGANISGIALNPDAILKAGIRMADTLANGPIGTGMISSIELSVIAAVIALIIAIAFASVAVELLLTLVYAYLGIGVGILLLAFGGSRFTAPASEGYFKSVIKTGVKILFIYAVLGIAMQMVAGWNAALAAACHPATVNAWSYPDPFSVPTYGPVTACTATISLANMLGFLAMAIVFALTVIGVPRIAAEMTGNVVGHALEHLGTAYLLSRNIADPIVRALNKSNDGANAGAGAGARSAAMQKMVAQTQQNTNTAATKVLNPFNGKPPGYNLATPQSTSPASPTTPPTKKP